MGGGQNTRFSLTREENTPSIGGVDTRQLKSSVSTVAQGTGWGRKDPCILYHVTISKAPTVCLGSCPVLDGTAFEGSWMLWK